MEELPPSSSTIDHHPPPRPPDPTTIRTPSPSSSTSSHHRATELLSKTSPITTQNRATNHDFRHISTTVSHYFDCRPPPLSSSQPGPSSTTMGHLGRQNIKVCLDCSPPAYHFDTGSGAGINNWLVHIEGGGWCNNVTTCLEHKDNRLVSSKQMAKQVVFSGILSNKIKFNPDFYNWNRIKVRYCHGASFTGYRSSGYNEMASYKKYDPLYFLFHFLEVVRYNEMAVFKHIVNFFVV
ncbi:uncharacterized protein LOC111406744 [Olea europaea var. sylvestris]|uniref:uncharacterized protein LOC111406744 n=1 Tax=Olea europaea var. sylvestris TaxID=158386 RepID=UPI000C1D49BE|nr:uncharacterized protein LOC111406744 [Olea europaea var. sylvestris]